MGYLRLGIPLFGEFSDYFAFYHIDNNMAGKKYT
jgi:hypothetical protein